MLAVLLRAKVVAVLLGPVGMGVNSLILSSIAIVQQFSSLGIFQSAVREMTQSIQRDSPTEVSLFRKIFLRLTLLCGISGTVAFIALSPLINHVSFKNGGYTYWLIGASLTLLFMSLQNGRVTIMQATRNLGLLAKASVVGAVCSLVVSCLLLYLYRIQGIVPALVSSYICLYLTFLYFERKIPFSKSGEFTKREFVDRCKPILKLGFVLMMSFTLMTCFTFLLNIFISRYGTVQDVGLYQAALSICATGITVINSLLSADFFPRASASSHDEPMFRHVINQQAEIMIYLVIPISLLLITFAPLVVSVLLSDQFKVTISIIQTMATALIFRTVWNILGYSILAKGDKNAYFVFDALIGNGFNFVLSAVTFYIYGLEGLGFAWLIGSVFMVILLSTVMRVRYGFSFDKSIIIKFTLSVTILGISYIVSREFEGLIYYMIQIFVLLLVSIYLGILLNRRLNFIKIFKNKITDVLQK